MTPTIMAIMMISSHSVYIVLAILANNVLASLTNIELTKLSSIVLDMPTRIVLSKLASNILTWLISIVLALLVFIELVMFACDTGWCASWKGYSIARVSRRDAEGGIP